MKPSNKEKARFLRTCIGEYILSPGESISDMQWLIHSVDLNGNVWVIHEKDNERVLLDDPDRLGPHEMSELNDIAVVKTSLSSISDEDAIEAFCLETRETTEDWTDEYMINEFQGRAKRPYNLRQPTVDFLRKRKYAIPFESYTATQLQEFGWIKLKE